MDIIARIQEVVNSQIRKLYSKEFSAELIRVYPAKAEHAHDFSIPVFPFAKLIGGNPMEIAEKISGAISESNDLFHSCEGKAGYLNLTLQNAAWLGFVKEILSGKNYGYHQPNGKNTMVEYCGPNTNKPLHLGHLRNVVIGFSVAEILKAAGHRVVKANMINDRGIHICRSMLSYQKFGNGETPSSRGIKGDHLIGEYYVRFEKELKKQIAGLVATGMTEEEAKKEAPLQKEIQQMLLDWEAGKKEVKELWKLMNGWVYEGFAETFNRIGIDFDKNYYESETYLLGKKMVEDGLMKNIFFKKPDGSVWINLTEEKLDEKLVLRADGTSVYITQDLGTADLKWSDYHCEHSVYVVATEQDYHFKVLQAICKKLGRPYAPGIYHLSYGMVDLPSGRMKSREGTVVDADELITEMESTAEVHTKELGKTEGFTEEELKILYHTIAMGALKFYLLRVDPKKKMIFNPEESIDFHGYTGPFIQYAHARIKSILRRIEPSSNELMSDVPLHCAERKLLIEIALFPRVILESADALNPAIVVNYVFQLAQTFNSFYGEVSVLKAESDSLRKWRRQLCEATGMVLASGMKLAGITAPERM